MANLNIMIVGVGGQGTLLTSRIVGTVALNRGLDVKMSEVHGMAQRGGSVVTYVKVGEDIKSPIIEKGEADIVLCFEKLEALRWITYLKKGGKLIVNDQRIDPMPVIIGTAKYPEDIILKLQSNYENIIAIDALSIAKECGTIKAVNTVLLGVMAKYIDIPKEEWLEAIKTTVKPKFIDINIMAFERGIS